MENFCLIDEAQIQLFEGQTGIRAGLPGEGKFPVTMFVEGDEGQGGKDILGGDEAPGLDASLLKGDREQLAEGIGAHLAQQGSFGPEFRQRRQEVGRGSTGMGRHGGITVRIRGQASKINEQFAQCDYIDHRITSLYSISVTIPPSSVGEGFISP